MIEKRNLLAIMLIDSFLLIFGEFFIKLSLYKSFSFDKLIIICYNISYHKKKVGVINLSPLRFISLINELNNNLLAINFSKKDVLIILFIIALFILIMCSSFFSSAETAYSSVNIIRLRSLVEEKVKGSKKALWIAENYDRTLTTILVGNNFVNIAATTIAAVLFTFLIRNDTLANVLNTVIMTIIVLIFGEILPKCFAKENPEKISLRYAGTLYFIIKILYPIVICFMGLRKLFSKNIKTEDVPTVTGSELDTIIDTMESEGEIDEDDADLMHGIVDTNTRTVYSIMIHRVDVIAIDIESTIEEMKNIFFEYKFSRIPVYQDDKDHIVGVLNERDFFTFLIKNPGLSEFDIKPLLTEPLYVSMSLKVDDLIRKMQEQKKHFAIVSDEYGGTGGIVTMEDAIEVITGEIYDEHDDVENIVEDVRKIDENTYEIDAEMPLEDLFELLELGKAPESRYSSIGGFLYGLAEELPEIGQTFEYVTKIYRQTEEDGLVEEVPINLHFTVMEMAERRIKTIKMVIDDTNNTDDNQVS